MDRDDPRYTRAAVEVYKTKTDDIVRRFLLRQFRFPDCVAALDAALSGLLPTLTPEDFDKVRAMMLANNDTVMDEMARRAAIDSKRTLR